MSEFPLIKSLQTKNDKTELPRGHKYIAREVIVEGVKQTVQIPAREIENFDADIAKYKDMSKYRFNEIMREVRGIRG